MSSIAECKNCSHSLNGRYCSQCGQDSHAHARAFSHVISEVTETFLHLDSTIWKTLHGLVVSPGLVAAEYLQGKRVRYTPPFRLYVVLSLVFFLVAAANDHLRLVQVGDNVSGFVTYSSKANCDKSFTGSFAAHWINDGFARACRQSKIDGGQQLNHLIWTSVPKTFLVLVPLFALLTRLAYWRSRMFYVEHLVFSTYFHCALFLGAGLLIVATDLLRFIPGLSPMIQSGIFDAAVYAFLCFFALQIVFASKRVFRAAWIHTLLASAILCACYVVAIFYVEIAAALYSMARTA